MGDEFNLNDAIGQASGYQSQSQGQNWNNQWGGPGPQYPGGYPAPAPGPGPGPQYPGFPPGGQQYPGFPAGGQPYPGGQPGGFPGYPGFPTPGAPMPGQPTDPKAAGQFGPTPSAPAPTGPLKLPYVFPLPSGIMPGLVLTIQGVVNPNAQSWAADFKINNNIVFHFNPRFNENPNVMVRNSLFNGQWGSEERTASKFPFQKGRPFFMQIFCEPEHYRVHVDNESLFQYKYRNRDFQQIKALHINGDITLNSVTAGMM